jgi:SAM-dependent methyltransferase
MSHQTPPPPPRLRPSSDPYFKSRYTWTQGRDRVWEVVCKYLRRFIPPDSAVLDLGAGYCAFINHVTAGEKAALDTSPDFVGHAGPGVVAHVGSCEDLGRFPDSRWGVVFASNLFEHLSREATDRSLAEILRVLTPTGRLIILQPNFYYSYRNYFDDYTHQQIFTHVGLADLLTARGFSVEKVIPRFLPFSLKSRWPTWPWLVALYLRLPYRPFAKQMLIVARPCAPQHPSDFGPF